MRPKSQKKKISKTHNVKTKDVTPTKASKTHNVKTKDVTPTKDGTGEPHKGSSVTITNSARKANLLSARKTTISHEKRKCLFSLKDKKTVSESEALLQMKNKKDSRFPVIQIERLKPERQQTRSMMTREKVFLTESVCIPVESMDTDTIDSNTEMLIPETKSSDDQQHTPTNSPKHLRQPESTNKMQDKLRNKSNLFEKLQHVISSAQAVMKGDLDSTKSAGVSEKERVDVGATSSSMNISNVILLKDESSSAVCNPSALENNVQEMNQVLTLPIKKEIGDREVFENLDELEDAIHLSKDDLDYITVLGKSSKEVTNMQTPLPQDNEYECTKKVHDKEIIKQKMIDQEFSAEMSTDISIQYKKCNPRISFCKSAFESNALNEYLESESATSINVPNRCLSSEKPPLLKTHIDDEYEPDIDDIDETVFFSFHTREALEAHMALHKQYIIPCDSEDFFKKMNMHRQNKIGTSTDVGNEYGRYKALLKFQSKKIAKHLPVKKTNLTLLSRPDQRTKKVLSVLMDAKERVNEKKLPNSKDSSRRASKRPSVYAHSSDGKFMKINITSKPIHLPAQAAKKKKPKNKISHSDAAHNKQRDKGESDLSQGSEPIKQEMDMVCTHSGCKYGCICYLLSKHHGFPSRTVGINKPRQKHLKKREKRLSVAAERDLIFYGASGEYNEPFNMKRKYSGITNNRTPRPKARPLLPPELQKFNIDRVKSTLSDNFLQRTVSGDAKNILMKWSSTFESESEDDSDEFNEDDLTLNKLSCARTTVYVTARKWNTKKSTTKILAMDKKIGTVNVQKKENLVSSKEVKEKTGVDIGIGNSMVDNPVSSKEVKEETGVDNGIGNSMVDNPLSSKESKVEIDLTTKDDLATEPFTTKMILLQPKDKGYYLLEISSNCDYTSMRAYILTYLSQLIHKSCGKYPNTTFGKNVAYVYGFYVTILPRGDAFLTPPTLIGKFPNRMQPIRVRIEQKLDSFKVINNDFNQSESTKCSSTISSIEQSVESNPCKGISRGISTESENSMEDITSGITMATGISGFRNLDVKNTDKPPDIDNKDDVISFELKGVQKPHTFMSELQDLPITEGDKATEDPVFDKEQQHDVEVPLLDAAKSEIKKEINSDDIHTEKSPRKYTAASNMTVSEMLREAKLKEQEQERKCIGEKPPKKHKKSLANLAPSLLCKETISFDTLDNKDDFSVPMPPITASSNDVQDQSKVSMVSARPVIASSNDVQDQSKVSMVSTPPVMASSTNVQDQSKVSMVSAPPVMASSNNVQDQSKVSMVSTPPIMASSNNVQDKPKANGPFPVIPGICIPFPPNINVPPGTLYLSHSTKVPILPTPSNITPLSEKNSIQSVNSSSVATSMPANLLNKNPTVVSKSKKSVKGEGGIKHRKPKFKDMAAPLHKEEEINSSSNTSNPTKQAFVLKGPLIPGIKPGMKIKLLPLANSVQLQMVEDDSSTQDVGSQQIIFDVTKTISSFDTLPECQDQGKAAVENSTGLNEPNSQSSHLNNLNECSKSVDKPGRHRTGDPNYKYDGPFKLDDVKTVPSQVYSKIVDQLLPKYVQLTKLMPKPTPVIISTVQGDKTPLKEPLQRLSSIEPLALAPDISATRQSATKTKSEEIASWLSPAVVPTPIISEAELQQVPSGSVSCTVTLQSDQSQKENVLKPEDKVPKCIADTNVKETEETNLETLQLNFAIPSPLSDTKDNLSGERARRKRIATSSGISKEGTSISSPMAISTMIHAAESSQKAVSDGASCKVTPQACQYNKGNGMKSNMKSTSKTVISYSSSDKNKNLKATNGEKLLETSCTATPQADKSKKENGLKPEDNVPNRIDTNVKETGKTNLETLQLTLSIPSPLTDTKDNSDEAVNVESSECTIKPTSQSLSRNKDDENKKVKKSTAIATESSGVSKEGTTISSPMAISTPMIHAAEFSHKVVSDGASCKVIPQVGQYNKDDGMKSSTLSTSKTVISYSSLDKNLKASSGEQLETVPFATPKPVTDMAMDHSDEIVCVDAETLDSILVKPTMPQTDKLGRNEDECASIDEICPTSAMSTTQGRKNKRKSILETKYNDVAVEFTEELVKCEKGKPKIVHNFRKRARRKEISTSSGISKKSTSISSPVCPDMAIDHSDEIMCVDVETLDSILVKPTMPQIGKLSRNEDECASVDEDDNVDVEELYVGELEVDVEEPFSAVSAADRLKSEVNQKICPTSAMSTTQGRKNKRKSVVVTKHNDVAVEFTEELVKCEKGRIKIVHNSRERARREEISTKYAQLKRLCFGDHFNWDKLSKLQALSKAMEVIYALKDKEQFIINLKKQLLIRHNDFRMRLKDLKDERKKTILEANMPEASTIRHATPCKKPRLEETVNTIKLKDLKDERKTILEANMPEASTIKHATPSKKPKLEETINTDTDTDTDVIIE